MRKVVQHGIGLPQVGIFVSGPVDDNWRMYSLVDTVFSYRVRMLLICLRYDGVFGLQSVKLQYFVLTKRCLVNNEGPNVPYSQSMAARVAAEVCV